MILAEDEASLYLQATTKRAWAVVGQTPLVRVHPQREHVHFYGCLNLATGQATVQKTDKMNSEATTKFLTKLLQIYPTQPILLLWDRAKWHEGKEVKEFLRHHPQIEVLKFPPASPDLNPQEHVWKATRQKVSHNHLTPGLEALAQAFETHIQETLFESSFLDKYGYSPICLMYK